MNKCYLVLIARLMGNGHFLLHILDVSDSFLPVKPSDMVFGSEDL